MSSRSLRPSGRKIGVAATAAALGLSGLGLAASPASAVPGFELERLAGVDRIETAVEISQDSFPSSDTALIARADLYPDALAGNYLAGAEQAPILLSHTGDVPEETLDELERLGAENVILLGGTSALSSAVETELESAGLNVDREAGTDRYKTAAAIATSQDAAGIGEVDGARTAILATGERFPDALTGGPLAYAGSHPILLTPTAALGADAAGALDTLGIEHVLILGGTAAVSQAAEDAVEAMGITTERLAGNTRYDTATDIAEWALANAGFTNQHINVATGRTFPDALTGGPHAGEEVTPIILANEGNTAEAVDYIEAHAGTLQDGHIFGGTAAVSAAVEAALEAAGQGAAVTSATIRPELISAEIVRTVTPGQATPSMPAGTYVRYTFDEPIALGATAGNFKVYYANASLAEVGDNASIEPGALSVVVRFGDQDTAAEAGALSVATVIQGAVLDAAGNSNPEGDAAIGDGSQSTVTAGVTAAPDVTAVGAYRQGNAVGTTAVDFTFDEAATVLNTTGFSLVLQNNTVAPCTSSTTPAAGAPSGGTVPGGSGTTTITVVCQNPDITVANPGGTPLSTANVARGAVAQGTVQDASAVPVPNPLETADSGNGGNTTGPDLVSASFVQGTNDSVLYVFDANVTATGATSLFNAYTSSGSQIEGTSATISATDARQVLVTFGSSTALDTAVGASVDPGAVTAGALGANQADEVPVQNTTATTIVPGRTAAPDLTGVALTAATGFSPASATFTFDQNVEPGAAIVDGRFHLYTANGVRLTASSCNRGTTLAAADAEAAGPSVTCAFGLTGDATTNANVINAVLGTVEAGAVGDDTNPGLTNPEGAELTTGGTGTPTT